MRLVVASLTLALAGCGGLERQYYPQPASEDATTGTVIHVQPYVQQGGESRTSRFGWGALSGGLVSGVAAGLADSDMGRIEAKSYILSDRSGSRIVINALTPATAGDCVAVHPSSEEGMHSLQLLPDERCIN